jgi:hypothetical protein
MPANVFDSLLTPGTNYELTVCNNQGEFLKLFSSWTKTFLFQTTMSRKQRTKTSHRNVDCGFNTCIVEKSRKVGCSPNKHHHQWCHGGRRSRMGCHISQPPPISSKPATKKTAMLRAARSAVHRMFAYASGLHTVQKDGMLLHRLDIPCLDAGECDKTIPRKVLSPAL